MLPAGNEVNLRSEVMLFKFGKSRIALTAAIDNLFDDVITPQLGLPLAGRMVRVGLRIT